MGHSDRVNLGNSSCLEKFVVSAMNFVGLLGLFGFLPQWHLVVAKNEAEEGQVVVRILPWRPTSAPPSYCCPPGHLHRVPSRLVSQDIIATFTKNCMDCDYIMRKIILELNEANVKWMAFDCDNLLKIETSHSGQWSLKNSCFGTVSGEKASQKRCKEVWKDSKSLKLYPSLSLESIVPLTSKPKIPGACTKPPLKCSNQPGHTHDLSNKVFICETYFTFTKSCDKCRRGMKLLLEKLEGDRMPWLLYDQPLKRCLSLKEIMVLCGWTPKPPSKPCPCGHTHQVPEDGLDRFESLKFEWGCPECGDVMHILCAMAAANKVPPTKIQKIFDRVIKGLKYMVSYPSWYYST